MEFRRVLKITTAKYFGGSLPLLRSVFYQKNLSLKLSSSTHANTLFSWNHSGKIIMRDFGGFIHVRKKATYCGTETLAQRFVGIRTD